MYGKRYLTGYLVAGIAILLVLGACKKDKVTYTPVPFLTGRVWYGDTVTINPPTTFNQLSPAEQQAYMASILWFRNAEITFNDDGTVTSGGDYDFGYDRWKLVNNNTDIEVHSLNGNYYILKNWVADAVHLSYILPSSASYGQTLVYK